MNANYGGDFTAIAKDYYKLVGDVVEKTDADIIGHFDLITKFIDKLNINISDEYLNVAFNAVHKLIPFKKPFEVNVGAISRGYRTTPYPSEDVLREIYRCGGEIIFTCEGAVFETNIIIRNADE